MPASEGTLTAADVAAHLGVPSDARMQEATAAVDAYAKAHWFHPDGRWYDAGIHRGGVLAAAAEYQARVTPEGMAGYDPSVGGTDTFTLTWRAKKFLQLDIGFA